MPEIFVQWGTVSRQSAGGFIKVMPYQTKSNSQTFLSAKFDSTPSNKHFFKMPSIYAPDLCYSLDLKPWIKHQPGPLVSYSLVKGPDNSKTYLHNLIICGFTGGDNDRMNVAKLGRDSECEGKSMLERGSYIRKTYCIADDRCDALRGQWELKPGNNERRDRR